MPEEEPCCSGSTAMELTPRVWPLWVESEASRYEILREVLRTIAAAIRLWKNPERLKKGRT